MTLLKQVFFKATPLSISARYLGVHELPGGKHHPQIVAWLQRVAPWATADEVAWCSAFAYHAPFELSLVPAKPAAVKCPTTGAMVGAAAARWWLSQGIPVEIDGAHAGADLVIFKRGTGTQPGPEVYSAPGHVAYYLERQGEFVRVLGGNQGNEVSIARYPISNILGIRRLQRAA